MYCVRHIKQSQWPGVWEGGGGGGGECMSNIKTYHYGLQIGKLVKNREICKEPN